MEEMAFKSGVESKEQGGVLSERLESLKNDLEFFKRYPMYQDDCRDLEKTIKSLEEKIATGNN